MTRIILLFISLILFSNIDAQISSTVTKTWSGGSVSIDGCGSYCTTLPGVTFSAADFGCSGSTYSTTDVNTYVEFMKVDGTCAAPGTGNTFANEVNFRLDAPSGTNVILALPGTYTGGGYSPPGFVNSQAEVTFDQAAGSVVGGVLPADGTFRPNNGNLNTLNGQNPIGTWFMRAGDTGGGDPLCVDHYSVTVTATITPPGNPAVFGSNVWNVYAYNGRNRDNLAALTYYGFYTESNLTYDSRNRWAAGSTPAAASGYQGCDPGIDNHTVVSKRQGFPCDVYQLNVTNFDDESKVLVNGTQVWFNNGCCGTATNIWTGVLDATSTVEFVHAEGGGGSHQGLQFVDVSTALSAGTITYGGNTTECVSYNPPTIGSVSAASGGASAVINQGTTAYQWLLNGSPIGGATSATYDPPVLNTAGTYTYSRRATDRCGATATTGTVPITIQATAGVAQSNGINEWYVSCYSGSNTDFAFNTYRGFYTNTTVNYDIGAHGIPLLGSPQNATGYAGCDFQSTDNWSLIGRRLGFPCGLYRVDLLSHDDNALILIDVDNDGTFEYNSGQRFCCSSGPTEVLYTAVLNANSLVVINLNEGGGNAFEHIQFVNVTAALNAGTISYAGSTTGCIGFDPSLIGGGANASGGASAAVTNGSTTYQWQLNGTDILGATGAAHDPAALGASGLYTYTRIATDKCGTTATTGGVNITISPLNTASAAGGATICPGDNANFTGSGTGDGTLGYQWQYFNGAAWVNVANGAPTGATYTGATGTSLNVATTNATPAASYSYRVNVSSTSPCPTVSSGTVSLVVVDDPIVNVQPVVKTVTCLNDVVSISVTASGGTPALNYQWQSSIIGGGVGFGNIALANSASYSPSTATPGTTYYRCVVSAAGTACDDVTSNEAEVVVTSASLNATLYNGNITAIEQCVDGGWTYYAPASDPEQFIFAINKNGSSYTATVDLVDETGNATYSSVGGAGPARGTFLIGRTWNVIPAVGSIISTSQSVRFFVNPAEVTQAQAEATAMLATALPGSAVTPLTFFKKSSGTFSPGADFNDGNFNFTPIYLGSGVVGTLNGATYYELSGIASFSGGTGGFSVNDDASALPVELLSFGAEAIDNTFIQVSWTTATEINNAGFELLRSQNGTDFEVIKWIEGNGNTNELQEYFHEDEDVNSGTYYYQLKQVDYNGDFEYFDVVSAKIDGSESLVIGEIVPNPTENNFSINLQTSKEELVKVNVFNYLGQIVSSKVENLNAGNSSIDMSAAKYPAGSYYVILELDNKVVTRKFVVSK